MPDPSAADQHSHAHITTERIAADMRLDLRGRVVGLQGAWKVAEVEQGHSGVVLSGWCDIDDGEVVNGEAEDAVLERYAEEHVTARP